MNARELLEFFIDQLTRNGQEITVSYNNKLECRQYDLNVGFKSSIKLSIENNILMARMRYDGKEEIESPLDLLELYDYWFDDATTRGWGRQTVSPAWKALYSVANVLPPVDSDLER